MSLVQFQWREGRPAADDQQALIPRDEEERGVISAIFVAGSVLFIIFFRVTYFGTSLVKSRGSESEPCVPRLRPFPLFVSLGVNGDCRY